MPFPHVPEEDVRRLLADTVEGGGPARSWRSPPGLRGATAADRGRAQAKAAGDARSGGAEA
jgi:hypothetical protein